LPENARKRADTHGRRATAVNLDAWPANAKCFLAFHAFFMTALLQPVFFYCRP
jgi:hypothetical protein